MDPASLEAWLRLALAPGLGPVTTRRLLGAFGLPQQVLAASDAALATVAGPATVRALRHPRPEVAAQVTAQVAACQRWLAQAPQQRRVLSLADAAYPAALLDTADPPPLLWVEGAAPDAPWPAAIAIVGSRNPTPQGASHARQFARLFAQGGWCVASGLALGVDAAAHEGALEGAGPAGAEATLAVVGTGLDIDYPQRHADLARRIAARGRRVSEQPLGTPPLARHFPRRNRLIAALSRGTLVVEAAQRSGSLITARCASEQGREVFAIPGSVHSPLSRGCHALIRQGATLVETAQDVLEALGPRQAPAAAARAPAPRPPCDDDDLLRALGFDPVSLDALVARTGWPTQRLQAGLLALELAGQVARLPGGLVQRIDAA